MAKLLLDGQHKANRESQMSSRTRAVFIVMATISSVGLLACQGPKGDQGPPGTDGRQGPPGPMPIVAIGGGLVGDGSSGAPLSMGAVDALHWNPAAITTTGVLASGPRIDLLRFLRYSNAPVLDAGSLAWENTSVLNPWIIRDGSQYRMYYAGRGTSWQIGMATASANPPSGTEWFAPNQWQRHAGNPIIQIGGWAGTDVIDPCVIKSDDPSDPRPYKMWFAGFGASSSIGFADSTDGLTWRQHAGNPVITQTLAAETSRIRWPSVILDRSSSTPYRMWYSCSDGSYDRVCHAISQDGVSWSKPQVNTTAASGYQNVVVSRIFDGGAWNQAQAPSVIKIGGTHYMTLARTASINVPWQIQLLMSRDGIAWTTVGHVLHSEDADWWWDSSLQDRANLSLDGNRAYLFYTGLRARYSIGAAVADLSR